MKDMRQKRKRWEEIASKWVERGRVQDLQVGTRNRTKEAVCSEQGIESPSETNKIGITIKVRGRYFPCSLHTSFPPWAWVFVCVHASLRFCLVFCQINCNKFLPKVWEKIDTFTFTPIMIISKCLDTPSGWTHQSKTYGATISVHRQVF